MSPSPSSHVVDAYPVPPRFPNERVAPTIQHLSKTPSTWTLTGAEGQAGTKTPMRLDSLRKDTLDGDDPGPQDPSPVVSQYDRNRLGEEPRPDRPKPSALPSEPAPPVSAPTQRTIRPQNQDGGRPSLLGRAVRKLKKFMRSKSVSIQRLREILTTGRKKYLTEKTRADAGVGVVDRPWRVVSLM